jgi:ribosomal protein S18 acetylase RimI-like enzyme
MSLPDSKIEKVEKVNQRMNKGFWITEIEETEEASFLFSDTIKDFFWSFATGIETENPENLIEEIEKFYDERERKPAAYITPTTEPEDLQSFLEEEGFSCQARDAWMFFRGGVVSKSGKLEFRLVDSDERAEKYMDVFRKSYGGAGKDEAYGELPDYYIEVLEKSFERQLSTEKIRDFLAFRDEELVGIGTVNFQEGFAGLFSIGVLPTHRGKGIGSEIVAFLVEKAQERNPEEIFLQTEKDSKNEDFFKKNGFEPG